MSDADLRSAAELVIERYSHPEYTPTDFSREEPQRRAALSLARAYLAEHRPDDGEPVDAKFLVSVGFRVERSKVLYHYRPFLRWDGGLQDYPGVRTRGDVRALLRLLGIEREQP